MIINIATDDSEAADDGKRPEQGGNGEPGSLTDPATLAKRGDIEATTATFEHDGADHCEAEAGGRAVVGVTNDAGEVLLWVHDAGHAVLPNVVVDAGDDWARAARGAVADAAGVALELDGVERVREVEHVLAADRDASDACELETTYHVVFAATATDESGDGVEARGDAWTAGWYDRLPAANTGERSVDADVRLFLDT